MSVHGNILSSLLFIALLGCQPQEGSVGKDGDESQSSASSVYTTVEWTELMPEADLEVLLNPPDYLNEIEEGSAEDQRMLELLNSANTADLDRYQQALKSTDIRKEFDGTDIRLAGYLVPLEFDSPEVVTQAFLVPYFGACIHVPPPPPNQMVLLNASDGLSLDDMYNPYWVSGELSAGLHEKELGTSAYEMTVDELELYSE